MRKFLKTVDFFVKKNKIKEEKIRIDVIAILRAEFNYKLTHYKNISV
ncbi:hypothetical protein HOG21_07090 [bacterium]|jgi:Holliday junction resolvase-like predicted endonuclease|nr:hypothetical protein [bacterium]